MELNTLKPAKGSKKAARRLAEVLHVVKHVVAVIKDKNRVWWISICSVRGWSNAITRRPKSRL